MNSFNHYAYGAIGDWMYRILQVLIPMMKEQDTKKIRILPHTGGNLNYAGCSIGNGVR